jgi:serine/threonine protein kinase
LIADNVQVEITDDKEGYYLFRVGEIISHYRIVSLHGKGVFGTVVKAEDTRSESKSREVAIKISRNNEAMFVLILLF